MIADYDYQQNKHQHPPNAYEQNRPYLSEYSRLQYPYPDEYLLDAKPPPMTSPNTAFLFLQTVYPKQRLPSPTIDQQSFYTQQNPPYL